jgi:hypothetical protein
LLLLLHLRSKYPPCQFVYFDLDRARLGHDSRFLKKNNLPEYDMIFLGQTMPETYGRIVDTQDELAQEAKNCGLWVTALCGCMF